MVGSMSRGGNWRPVVRRGLEDFDALTLARRARHAGRSRFGRRDRDLIETYLGATEEPKLHIGCGTRLFDGWLNSDVSPRTGESIRLDITRRLPFEDATFQYVYNEHVIEHVPVPEARFALGEFLRVLRPGGVLRTATPDLRVLLSLLRETPPLSPFERAYIDLMAGRHWPDEPLADGDPVYTLNNSVREWGHRFIWDRSSFSALLTDIGFVDLTWCELQESTHPQLRNRANDVRKPPGMVAFDTMTVEASRPT